MADILRHTPVIWRRRTNVTWLLMMSVVYTALLLSDAYVFYSSWVNRQLLWKMISILVIVYCSKMFVVSQNDAYPLQ
jgi:hypothetical protein